MINKPFLKKLSIFILILIMAGCIPMGEAGIDKKAASVAEKVIRDSEKLKEEKKESKKEKTKYDLAEVQVLNLSGRYYYNLDPMNAYGESMNLLNLVFPGLTRYDTESGEFLPVLAKNWEVSENLLTWTFTLRDDITWVNYNTVTQQVEQVLDAGGKPIYVTAEDVKARIMQVLDPNEYSFNSYLLTSIAGAEDYTTYFSDASSVQIEVPTSTELVVHLTEPDAGFLALTELTMFSASASWSDEYNYAYDTYFYGPYVPTGAISFNNESLTLMKNPFWIETEGLAGPYLETINFNMQYEQDVLEAFKNEELDAVLLTTEEYQLALTDPELSKYLVSAPGSYGYYLLFNNTNLEPIDDVDIRRSVASAIDKTTLLDGLYGESGTVLEGFIPDFLHDEPFSGIPYSTDPGNTVDTLPLASLDFLYSDYTNTSVVAENVAAQLTDHLGWYVYPYAEQYENLYSDLQYTYTYSPGIYLLTFNLDANDQQKLWDYLEDSTSFVEIQKGNWNNAEFNALFDQAKAELDSAKRAELFAQMEEILVNEDVMIIPLYWSQQNWLVRSDVAAEILPVYQQLENWARIIP